MTIPHVLVDRLSRRQCVAFVGAGFSMACGMPSWKQLLVYLLDEARRSNIGHNSKDLMGACEQAVQDGSYSMAASMLRDLMPPGDLDEAIRKCFGMQVLHRAPAENQVTTRRRMENLVRAPWAGIVTTNYDELIEDALNRHCTLDFLHAHGPDPRLGTILANASAGSVFFVKVHGSISGSRIVLGTEEYDRVYLGRPPMVSFLTALMLRYHIVFIGCSLEDELIRLRRRLCMSFRGLIPPAYALLPETPNNQARRAWLRQRAMVDCIFYATTDHRHSAVDEFLTIVAAVAQGDHSDLDSTREELMKAKVSDRLDNIGLINRELLEIVAQQPQHILRHIDLLNLEKLSDARVSSSLAGLTPEERTYRMLFLASLQLVNEGKTSDGARVYHLKNAEVIEAIARDLKSGRLRSP